MNHRPIYILIINAGSSSIKLALYQRKEEWQPVLSGKISRIGLKDASFTIKKGEENLCENIPAESFHAATSFLTTWLEKQDWFPHVKAIGHRIVHGMAHTQPQIVTDQLLQDLQKIASYDPDHLPAEINLIRAFQEKHPQLIQVACFDTAFHTHMPPVAKTIPIPKEYREAGLQRYGFHGISYSYLMQELTNINAAEARGRIILAHLGNGASITAVKEGRSIDTSMGFTPAAGLVMSTRSGDIDPGIAWYLMQQGLDAKAFNELINHQSGLLAISGSSSDMQDLLKQKEQNKDAALAIDTFCYQLIKYIGAYTAVLGGLDILVFSGGIGEHAAPIREQICLAFEYAGIHIHPDRNNHHEQLISSEKSKVKVYIIPTKEEQMIAAQTAAIFQNQSNPS